MLITRFALASLLLAAGCTTPAPTTPRSVSMAAATCDKVVYPAEARGHGAAGKTRIDFEVDALGKVTRVAIVGASGATPGHRLLDEQAFNVVAKCKFPPAPGHLPAKSTIEYVWRLED